jgi:hypothetical protein
MPTMVAFGQNGFQFGQNCFQGSVSLEKTIPFVSQILSIELPARSIKSRFNR